MRHLNARWHSLAIGAVTLLLVGGLASSAAAQVRTVRFFLWSNAGQDPTQGMDRVYLVDDAATGVGNPGAQTPGLDVEGRTWSTAGYMETRNPDHALSRWDRALPAWRAQEWSNRFADLRALLVEREGVEDWAADWIWFNNLYPNVGLVPDTDNGSVFGTRFLNNSYANGYLIADANDDQSTDQVVFVRKPFAIPSNFRDGWHQIHFYLEADGEAEGFLNGSPADVRWMYDLQAGANTLGFRAWNHGQGFPASNPAALVYTAVINYQYRVTDLTVRADEITYANGRISARVRNVGPDRVDNAYQVGFFLGDPRAGGVRVGGDIQGPALLAGGSGQVHAMHSIVGQQDVYVVVDWADAFGRSAAVLGGQVNLLGGAADGSGGVSDAIGRIQEINELDNMAHRVLTDSDGDGWLDADDNCPQAPNPDQSDRDHDGRGDVCDFDRDNDGIPDDADNCPDTPNPYRDCDDNAATPDEQCDWDRDFIGDVCDPDDDNDGLVEPEDNCQRAVNPYQPDHDADADGDP